MDLYIWTYFEYDACDHHGAFASSEAEARLMIREEISSNWLANNQAPGDPEHLVHLHNCVEEDLKSFDTDARWSLQVYECKTGVIVL